MATSGVSFGQGITFIDGVSLAGPVNCGVVIFEGVSLPLEISQGSLPVNDVAPALSTPSWEFFSGPSEISCDDGTWSGDDITFSYQWFYGSGYGGLDNTPIPGETNNTIQKTTPSLSFSNTEIYCVVTATNGAGSVDAQSDSCFLFMDF